MARYRLTETTVMGDVVLTSGTEIEFDGVPGPHMHQLDKGWGKEVPGPAPLDPLYRAVSGEVFTGFFGFPAEFEEPAPTEPPINVDVPYAVQNGYQIDCTVGNWEGMSVEPHSYAYQWIRDGETNIGLGVEFYMIVAGTDVGHEITCVVTATNLAGSTAAPPSNTVTVQPVTATRR